MSTACWPVATAPIRLFQPEPPNCVETGVLVGDFAAVEQQRAPATAGSSARLLGDQTLNAGEGLAMSTAGQTSPSTNMGSIRSSPLAVPCTSCCKTSSTSWAVSVSTVLMMVELPPPSRQRPHRRIGKSTVNGRDIHFKLAAARGAVALNARASRDHGGQAGARHRALLDGRFARSSTMSAT